MATSNRSRWLVLSLFAFGCAVTWSSSKQAVAGAAATCMCSIEGQVWNSGVQIGGDDDSYTTSANDVVDCAGICQNRTLQLGATMCNNYAADTYTTQWQWSFWPINGPFYDNVEQQYGCADIGR